MRDGEGKPTREADAASPPRDQRPATRRPASRPASLETAPEGVSEAPRVPIPESAEPGVESRASSEKEIRELAYEIYLSRGASDGHDLDDWYAAERELRARLPRDRRPRPSGPETS
jgi:hypothetical protein